MTDIAMLHQNPHPAHRGFAEAIGATLVSYRHRDLGRLNDSILADVYNGFLCRPYDIILVEGSRPLYAAMIHKARYNSTVVYLCADHGFYTVGREDFKGDSPFKQLIGRFGRLPVQMVARWGIDGVIAVSEFAASFTRPIVGADTPIEIAHPYVQPSVYESLRSVEPDIDSSVVVTVGRAAEYKGVDMLVKAWPRIRNQFGDATLHVVGSGHPEWYENVTGVLLDGYVDELASVFDEASLYVQPSRVDTFPVSVLEALVAGLPCVVTETTGTRSEVECIDSQLVVEPTPEGIARGICDYLKKDTSERQQLSEMSRARGERFNETLRTDEFAEAFERVLNAL